MTIYIIGIYRPPYSDKHPVTIGQFLDDFTEFLAVTINTTKNVIICGDFNVHYDDTNNPDVNIYIDICEAMGLIQHCGLPTHRSGHTLDHFFSEKVTDCQTGSYISDHCSVTITLEAEKDNIQRKTITNRNYKRLDREKFMESLDFKTDTDDIETLENGFDSVVKNSLDKLAPVRTRTITVRQNKDWFTDELRHLRSCVRRRERIFRKYKEDHQWIALKKTRNSYKYKLKVTKREVQSEMVNNCKGNTKKLYQTFNNLTGVKVENPLPEGKQDHELAEEFFLSKIEKIRNNLQDVRLYCPTSERETNQVDEWQELSEGDVKKIITSLATKTCEEDTMPTSLLKEVLDRALGIITKIINCSISQGSCVVNIREHNSAPRELSFSVPQGSCAGPVLYLAYASTLEKEVSQNIGIHGYADDHDYVKHLVPIVEWKRTWP